MHAAHVAGVLNLEATVHDHCQAAFLSDPRALAVDHTELAPQGVGPDLDSLSRDPGQCVRRPEDVHDVHMFRHVKQALVGLLPEDLSLADTRDEDFGPFFLKFCSYFPYGAKLCA